MGRKGDNPIEAIFGIYKAAGIMCGLAYKGAMAIEKNRIKKEKELAKQQRLQERQLKQQHKEQERRERERAKEQAKREEIAHKQDLLEYICKSLEDEFGEINVNKIKASESYAKKMLNYGLKNSRSFLNMATKVVKQAPDYKNCETVVFAVKSYLNNIENNISKFNTFIKSNIVSDYEYKIAVLILEELQQEMESIVNDYNSLKLDNSYDSSWQDKIKKAYLKASCSRKFLLKKCKPTENIEEEVESKQSEQENIPEVKYQTIVGETPAISLYNETCNQEYQAKSEKPNGCLTVFRNFFAIGCFVDALMSLNGVEIPKNVFLPLFVIGLLLFTPSANKINLLLANNPHKTAIKVWAVIGSFIISAILLGNSQ